MSTNKYYHYIHDTLQYSSVDIFLHHTFDTRILFNFHVFIFHSH